MRITEEVVKCKLRGNGIMLPVSAIVQEMVTVLRAYNGQMH